MYAIVETGGKQYRVEPGATIEVERLEAAAGDEVILDRVLLVSQEGEIVVGHPYVEKAQAVCRALGDDRAKKVEIFTYKAKKNVRRRKAHRQSISRLKVENIVVSH